jgi:peptidyl-prolyl cis-trans isomerase C
VRNTLLADEARRRGYDKSPQIAIATKKAIAQALLRSKVGEAVTADNQDPARLKRYYESNIGRYVHGIKRRVVHLVAETDNQQLSESEALQVVEKARKAALGAVDEADFITKVQPFESALGPVKTETLPPFEADNNRLVRPFVEATFAIAKVGDLSPPVKTRFGLHIIYLAEEIAAINRSFEDAKKEIAQTVLPESKRAETAEIMSSLLSDKEIFIFDNALKEGSFPE